MVNHVCSNKCWKSVVLPLYWTFGNPCNTVSKNMMTRTDDISFSIKSMFLDILKTHRITVWCPPSLLLLNDEICQVINQTESWENGSSCRRMVMACFWMMIHREQVALKELCDVKRTWISCVQGVLRMLSSHLQKQLGHWLCLREHSGLSVYFARHFNHSSSDRFGISNVPLSKVEELTWHFQMSVEV